MFVLVREPVSGAATASKQKAVPQAARLIVSPLENSDAKREPDVVCHSPVCWHEMLLCHKGPQQRIWDWGLFFGFAVRGKKEFDPV